MARNTIFQFKQFQIDQSLCAMKVTTDAIVFGAMVDVSQCQSILDIGAGTGLLSLMMAQRASASVTAVELDKDAIEQSLQNIKNSPWPDQVTVVHNSIQNFATTRDEPFDCIVSNPPFFQESLKGPDQQRNLARHTDSLNFSALVSSIKKLLTPTGEAWILLPVDSAKTLLKIASDASLFPTQITELKSTSEHPSHRWVMCLSHQKSDTDYQSLVFYNQQKEYTEDFKRLTRDYYLKL